MKRPQQNFAVDAVAFVLTLALISTGFVLRYILPPGSGELAGRGAGSGAGERAIILLWGFTRHEWGAIHFWIAVTLLIVLALHLVLHFQWIMAMTRGRSSEASGKRLLIGATALIVLIALAIAPFLTPTEQVKRSDLRQGTADIEAPHGMQSRGK